MNLLTDPPSMLDVTVLDRNLHDCISIFPVMAQFRGIQFQVRLFSTADVDVLMAAGLLDDFSVTIIAAKSDIGLPLPESFEEFDIQQASGDWLTLEVRSVPDRVDPLSPILTIILQSPHK